MAKSAVDFQGVFLATCVIWRIRWANRNVCLFIKHSLFNDLLCGTAFISLSCFRCVNVLLDSKEKSLEQRSFGFGLAVIASALAIEVGQKANFNTSGLIFLAICILGGHLK